MKKYTRHTAPKIPDKETIAKHKNFKDTYQAYEKFAKRPKKPLYKQPKNLLILVLIVVIAYIISEVIDK